MAFKKHILDISCKGSTTYEEDHLLLLWVYTFPKREAMTADGLVEWSPTGVKLTEQGHCFIRAVCSAFDLCLQRGVHFEKPFFSKAI